MTGDRHAGICGSPEGRFLRATRPPPTHLAVMCWSRSQAEAALARLTDLLADLGLEPKAAKTRVVHLEEGGGGFDFLGFHHRLVRSRGLGGKPRVTFLARWPSDPVQGQEQAAIPERRQQGARQATLTRRARERLAQDLAHPPLLPLARRATRQGHPRIADPRGKRRMKKVQLRNPRATRKNPLNIE